MLNIVYPTLSFQELEVFSNVFKYSIFSLIKSHNSNNNNNNNNNNLETTKSENYRKQPYWALHTYFGKC
jgi:hypothetical protein